MAYWFHVRFGASIAALGSLFFGANLLAAASALLAHRIAARVGLVNTMVFTHLPSNVLLVLVPLMPTMAAAMTVLLLRFASSQMDVPTRQSYTMAAVAPDERAAAAGVTGIARSIGAGLAPVIGGAFLLTGSGAPFFVVGSRSRTTCSSTGAFGGRLCRRRSSLCSWRRAVPVPMVQVGQVGVGVGERPL